MCLVSLGLLDPNLTWFTFPQPGFSKTCWGTFPSASRHQHVEKSRFTWPWEPNQVCASFPSAFWTQTNFDLGLLSLSLVSQKLVGTFPSASRHQHVEKSRFTWPCEPNWYQVCAKFPLVFWTQTFFYMGLLFLSLVSQKLVGVRFPQLHGTYM